MVAVTVREPPFHPALYRPNGETARRIKVRSGDLPSVSTVFVPVTLGDGERIEQLTARSVTIGDVRSVANLTNEIERELKIMARVTGLVPEDLDLLDYSDYVQLQDCFRR